MVLGIFIRVPPFGAVEMAWSDAYMYMFAIALVMHTTTTCQ